MSYFSVGPIGLRILSASEWIISRFMALYYCYYYYSYYYYSYYYYFYISWVQDGLLRVVDIRGQPRVEGAVRGATPIRREGR